MQSLTEHYGQPHHLALQRIAELMDSPNIQSGDTQAFRRFALDHLDDKGTTSGSHVARLMSKLSHDVRPISKVCLSSCGASQKEVQKPCRYPPQAAAILYGAEQSTSITDAKNPEKETPGRSVYFHYCDNKQHFLNQCSNFPQLTSEFKTNWIKMDKKCWRCGRKYQIAQCRMKATCKVCMGKHLTALHVINSRSATEGF